MLWRYEKKKVVYFFEGAHDINAPLYIAKEYYEMLECPKKEWVLFEHSGHSPWKNENTKFVHETIRVFLGKRPLENRCVSQTLK